MGNLLKAEVKKLIHDWRIWMILVAACAVPIAIIFVSAKLPQIDLAASRAGDYTLLHERIRTEIELQEDEAVRQDYEAQDALVQQMEYHYNQGRIDQEISLQNEMERAELAGKKQVYYEDVFAKYLGLNKTGDIEDRIYYREYLVLNKLDLACSLDTKYSIIRVIYGFVPVLIPLAVLMICMTITMLFTNEAMAGTTKLWLINPYQRWKMMLSKQIVSFIVAGIIALIFGVILILPLCFQQSDVPFTYPIEINFPTVQSFMIGNGHFVTAENFLMLCLLFLPANILFYLSLFTLLSISFSSSAYTILLFITLAVFSVLSVGSGLPFITMIPLYYTNPFLLLTGASQIQNLTGVFAALLFSSVAIHIWSIQVFVKKDYFS